MTFNLQPPKSNQFILETTWTFLPNLKTFPPGALETWKHKTLTYSSDPGSSWHSHSWHSCTSHRLGLDVDLESPELICRIGGPTPSPPPQTRATSSNMNLIPHWLPTTVHVSHALCLSFTLKPLLHFLDVVYDHQSSSFISARHYHRLVLYATAR